MRYIAQFRKTDSAAYIAHLDLMRFIQRSLRRADFPLAYSMGFNPHPVLSFAMPSGVGMESESEYMDVGLSGEAFDEAELTSAINAQLPDELAVIRGRIVEQDYPTLMGQVKGTRLQIAFVNAVGKDLNEGWLQFLEKDPIQVEKKGKSGSQTVNIRPMIFQGTVKGNLLVADVAAGSAATLGGKVLAWAFAEHAGISPEVHIRRLSLWGGTFEEQTDLMYLR